MLTISSCAPSEEEQTNMLLNEAVQSFMKKNYGKSKVFLDSVIYTYPHKTKQVQQAKDMLKVVYKNEQERNLLFLDSLLDAREEELKPMMSQFDLVDNFDEIPWYEHKRQKASNSFSRSYLKVHVNKIGRFYISSHLNIARHIHHYKIKVSNNDTSVASETIEDNSSIHEFEDGGMYWEIVSYKQNTDNGIAEFIANHYTDQLKVEYIGSNGSTSLTMNSVDKEAIRNGYEVSFLLREMVQIKQQIRTVQQALKNTK